MSSTTTSLINYNFGGIRRKDSAFSDEKITCSDCQNVELFFTKLNSGVGIRNSNGNKSITEYTDLNDELQNLIPEGQEVVGIFESTQDGITFFIVYTESSSEGFLYNFNVEAKEITLIVRGLQTSGDACATDFAQGWNDMFVFSNGKDIKYIYSNTQTHERLIVESSENIHLIDTENRDVMGLGIVVYDKRLWVFDGTTLWYSMKEDCRDFSYVDASARTSAGYIEFVKPITAIYPYLGTLAVFHKDSSALVNIDADGFKVEDESPGGCASYNSLVFHGTDLYFYDDTKKGVFSFRQIVNGDKTLGDNIAYDIQDELLLIKKDKLHLIRALSVVTADRNEVWFLIPINDTYKVKVYNESTGEYDTIEKEASNILIFDYIRGEWIKRKCQHINAIGVVDSVLYSGGESVYEEYVGNSFNGDFIESYYTCTVFNLGSDNTLKITKFPPRATLDNERKCHFWVRYIKNYNHLKSVKEKELKGKTLNSIAYYDSGYHYDEGWVYSSSTNVILKLPSTTFKALEIKFYTTNVKETFALKTLEFSKIKVKQI